MGRIKDINGYTWVQYREPTLYSKIQFEQLIKLLDPEGVEQRRAQRLRRKHYCSKGPNALWHMDGYDKLKPFTMALL